MPEIAGVYYGEAAFEHMRELHAKAQATLDGELDPEILAEAETMHEFHRQFPGIVMKEPDA